MHNRVSAIPGVLTVEVDLNSVSEGQKPPPPLDRPTAETLGWSMAEDLRRMLGELDRYGLVTLGGLYDMTELLRPGLPIVDILLELYRRSLPDTRFQPHLITIGAQGDAFPIAEIAPRRTPGSGPLFLIPFLFVGEPDAIDTLGIRMEKALLEKGQASMKTGTIIQSEFAINPLNLSYATFNDLYALLKIQLENSGFGELWTLLDAALFPRGTPARVQLREGNLFLIDQNIVYTRYPGFPEWAERFKPGDDVLAGYADWQRLQRQYTAGLEAHGLTVRTVPGIQDTRAMETLEPEAAFGLAQQYSLPDDSDRMQEVLADTGNLAQSHRLTVVEHRLPQLGPVAFTVSAETADGQTLFMANEYPLTPAALQTIPESWRNLASEYNATIEESRPGTLLHASTPPRLVTAPEDNDRQSH
ncbi:MAG: hypothetical protein WED00_17470 [Aquisalimonadaceae bacterium]